MKLVIRHIKRLLKGIIKFLIGLTVFSLGAFIALIALLYGLTGNMNVFIQNYPQISGLFGQERNYLIIFQNNNELRSTGGFISSYGVLKLKFGVPIDFEIEDVYGTTDQHKCIEAPYPMNEMLKLDCTDKYSYSFRDANYFPDFADTSAELEKMFKLTHPEANFDGVIAVNYSYIESVLGVIGEMQIDGEKFNKENLFENIEFDINNIDKHSIEDLKNRKNILKKLASELVKQVISSPLKWDDLINETESSLNSKQIQIFFKDEELENKMVEKGWAGVWPDEVDGDFLAINEMNLGGHKSDRYIKREITYHVKLEKPKSARNFKATGEVTIDMYHYGIMNLPLSGEYRGYIEIYAPLASRFMSVSREKFDEVEYENYKKYGNEINIGPGEETEIRYSYQLPKTTIEDGEYHLYIPKQSGADGDIYNVIIELPQGYNFESDKFQNKENIAYYSGVLDKDLSLSLKILPDEKAPFVVYQNIDDYTKIAVAFNENMDKASVEEIENYILVDENYANKKTDELEITKAELEENTLILYVAGMSKQFGEHYKLSFENIKDYSGNSTDPSKYEITLVQRL